MEDMSLALNAHSSGWLYRLCVLRICPASCCHARQKELKEKFFYGRWMNYSQACEPDEIQWENLGYPARSRMTRRCCSWVIAFAMIFVGILGLVSLNYYADSLNEEF